MMTGIEIGVNLSIGTGTYNHMHDFTMELNCEAPTMSYWVRRANGV